MNSNRLLIIDGNSIMNRAFYGIMGAKIMMTPEGIYTNAVYGFLSILFKELDDLKPDYIAVSFDLKAPTHRHKMYDAYKGTRHAMPDELAMQMPIIKEILQDMNIKIIEKEGFEADDILGTLSKEGEKEGHFVTILSGDRDTFQLASDKVTIRIPRTKMGKTETEEFDEKKIKEVYGIKPKQLIDVKGLMGDSSDNIPGVPGIGEKTALSLIQEYGSIEKIYKEIEKEDCKIKASVKSKLTENEELAKLSKTLGTILLDAPTDTTIQELAVKSWDNEKVKQKFEELRFNRFLDRFDLSVGVQTGKENEQNIDDLFKINKIDFEKDSNLDEIIEAINKEKEIIYHFSFEEVDDKKIINKTIKSMSLYNHTEENIIYIYNIDKKLNEFINEIKPIFENNEINKIGYRLSNDYVILREFGINYSNIYYDAEIAGYDLNPTNKDTLEELSIQYLNLNIDNLLSSKESGEEENPQLNLFDVKENVNNDDKEKYKETLYTYIIAKLKDITIAKLKEVEALDLFQKIEMPLVEILGSMQYDGMYVDKESLKSFGKELENQLENLTKEIYELAGEEFNINSHQQLGKILFEKLELPAKKKTKNGYSTDVDVLEKIRNEHPIVEKILNYRSLAKLNSTYVVGLLPYINETTNRIHSYFHQTITATGRISSTEPNLQNIPTREEIGKNIRKAFKPADGKIYIDADYSQIELRVLAHISNDQTMIDAFKNGEDIHKQAASKVFEIPIEEVTKEQRSSAKAVNFGIVYGISDFGLANQIGVSNKQAKEYIEQYLEKYNGIKQFMNDIVESAKEKGYVETLFHRRRYIPEINSNSYLVRQFGSRVAMNTPIQGTAADIMKIAMRDVFRKLKEEKLDAKIVLQIHDELLLEVSEKDKEKAKKILEKCMTNAATLIIPLEVELSEGYDWSAVK